ncbi:GRAS family protein RAM1-like [Actinidia eriantha]|uniref:GRAS family protein RAM1-like n=1 Tax=Actinidia eriantha TaxID=165200 RepID=UPI00258FEC79|nr:GRAS family protein RAM1-like [Actinidia eriantha]
MSSHYKHEQDNQIILLKTKVSDFFFKMANTLFSFQNEMESFCSKYGLYQENLPDRSVNYPKYFEAPPPQAPISNYDLVGDFKFNTPFLSTLPIPETAILENIQRPAIVETQKEEQFLYSLQSLELLNNYASRSKKLEGERNSYRGDETNASERKLSTEGIMRVAGERYIQFSTQRVDEIVMFMHPYGFSFSGISFEETRDVELAHLLLAAAEKVGNQQFERASRMLDHCEWLASPAGNPVQRVVYYFAGALRERIDRVTGRFLSRRRPKEEEKYDMRGLGVSSNLLYLKIHQQLPFTQVMLFAGIQAILESVELETKIHLIDLQIRSGVQWIILMQALADRVKYPIEYLKITAVGTAQGEKMVETGKKLASYAKSLNLPFLFKVVLLSDMKDLKKEHFHTEACEATAVIFQTILRSMISRPYCLENLMRVIRRLNPAIMVVGEVEANHNSPSFFSRFIEALFFYSAYFDCLEDCMNGDDKYRIILEGMVFRDGIHNIVAAEGEERYNRNVKMSVWKTFFTRFGMVGIGLSESSLYQANLIVKQFSCGSSCTLESDGNCLIVGWKGSPIHSLSTWKFL